MPLALIVIFLILLIICISVLKLDTFISFIVISIGLGIASNLGIKQISEAIQKGIGNTLGELVLIIGFGAMLGKMIEISGAANVITDKLISTFGESKISWCLALAGLILGIPIFYTAGFILVVPIIFGIAQKTRLPILYLAISILSALSVAHGFLPPHPSPTAISNLLGADLSKTMLYGLLIALPAISLAGPIFAKTIKMQTNSVHGFVETKNLPKPSFLISLGFAIMPVLILSLSYAFKSHFANSYILELISVPFIAILLTLILALYFLGIRQGLKAKYIQKELEKAIKDISPILLVLAGAGAFKQIIVENGSSQYLAESLSSLSLNPLILGWLIAAIIRVCLGSATIAGLTTASIILPLMKQDPAINKELMVLAIGAGSLMLSHINDSGFWLFKEYFNLTIKQTLKTWTVMESIVSIVGLLGVLVLNLIMH